MSDHQLAEALDWNAAMPLQERVHRLEAAARRSQELVELLREVRDALVPTDSQSDRWLDVDWDLVQRIDAITEEGT